MKKYVVKVEEVVSDSVIVEANSYEEAEDMVRTMIEAGTHCVNLEGSGYTYRDITETYKKNFGSLDSFKSDIEDYQSFYFTFGSNEQFPFLYGWVQVIATSIREACKIFRNHYPDVHKGFVNCAFVYTSDEFFQTEMPQNGNCGYFCHRILCE